MINNPTVEERYSQAIHSSNLKVEADKQGSADTLIAVAWSKSRLGSLLMRLQTSADRLALEQAHEQVTIKATAMGLDRPEAVAASVMGWWLDGICKACHGRKFEQIANTPSLSTRQCKACRGTGKSHLSYGEAGKELAGWLDGCKEQGLASTRNRLRPG